MYWHGRYCTIEVEPVYEYKVKRNCLIQMFDTKEMIVVPRRALRRDKQIITKEGEP